ncbi:hypothetical protein ACLOJK_018006 [Asimina triloba]
MTLPLLAVRAPTVLQQKLVLAARVFRSVPLPPKMKTRPLQKGSERTEEEVGADTASRKRRGRNQQHRFSIHALINSKLSGEYNPYLISKLFFPFSSISYPQDHIFPPSILESVSSSPWILSVLS